MTTPSRCLLVESLQFVGLHGGGVLLAVATHESRSGYFRENWSHYFQNAGYLEFDGFVLNEQKKCLEKLEKLVKQPRAHFMFRTGNCRNGDWLDVTWPSESKDMDRFGSRGDC